MPVIQPPGTIFEQTPNEIFITLALHMGDDKLAHRVDYFCFPHLIFLITSKAPTFICLQAAHSYVPDSFVMKLSAVPA